MPLRSARNDRLDGEGNRVRTPGDRRREQAGWFLEISPLGKTPVLLVDGEAIFESAVIGEFLDETEGAQLHPEAPLLRARHRAWIEFGSSLLNTIAAFYNAADDDTLDARTKDIRHRFEQREATLGEGPYFAVERFSMVDAVFGPIFRYFDAFEALGDFDFLGGAAQGQGLAGPPGGVSFGSRCRAR